MKKKIFIGIAIFGGILLLGGAAFLAARLLGEPQLANGLSGVPGSGTELRLIPAAELPERNPDMTAAVTELKDNSLMVTSLKGVTTHIDESGEAQTKFDYDGSAVEVVMTQETVIYIDTTREGSEMSAEPPQDGTVIELQQTLRAAGFSDLAAQDVVSIWGYKRGDRLIAEIMVTEKIP